MGGTRLKPCFVLEQLPWISIDRQLTHGNSLENPSVMQVD